MENNKLKMDVKQYFQYPITSKELLLKKKKIKRILQDECLIKKNIAILGGSTTNEIADQLTIALMNYGIDVNIYQSEYGKFFEDAIFGNDELDNFSPNIIYIHTNWRNIKSFPKIGENKETIDNKLNNEFEYYKNIWETLRKKFHCIIIQNNFERPNYRLMGNRDVWDIHGYTNYISKLNQKFYEYAQNNTNFYINDIDYLASDFGLTLWNDSFCWHMYKYAMSLQAIPILANNLAHIIKSIYGKNKKTLMVDLDNTMWGGIIGDDGVEGIEIGPESSKGQMYLEIQNYCKKLKDIGVILTVNSKNDYDNAIAGLKQPDGVLKPEDFVVIKANWNSKDINLIETAKEINIGVDSFVFLDDNPAEQNIIRMQIPEASVLSVEKPEQYIEYLDHEGYFETTILSEEDKNKTLIYQENYMREKALSTFENYEDYLKSLEMKAYISEFESMYVQRISQLTNKSNQFNLTTLRCSETEILSMKDSSDWITLYGKLEDKFGDNGVVTVLAGNKQNKILNIELWLMSCRVLKRTMEDLMMNTLVDVCKREGISTIIGKYLPTKKNHMVENFYGSMGFTKKLVTDEKTIWELNVNNYKYKNTAIEVVGGN